MTEFPVRQAREMVKKKQLPKNFVVVYDDGVKCPTTTNRFILTDMLLMMVDLCPKVPISHTYRIEHFLKDKMLNRSTINDALTHIMRDCWYISGFKDQAQMETLTRAATDISHHIANVMYVMTEEYVMSMDILDFLELSHHPAMKKIFDGIQPNDNSIKQAYRDTLEFLMNDPGISHNAVAVAVRCKMVNSSQITQCLTVRGKVTEVDGHIMSVPVLTNFTRGMRNLADIIKESRSAAKNAFFSEAPIQDSEYFARRLQHICMVVERIAPGDCGSTNYENWLIDGPHYDDIGTKTRDSDLTYMVGKKYLDEKTGQLLTIQGDETYLYGKIVKLRSGHKCAHKDKHAICETCFGELARNVPRHANIGHLSAAIMTQQSTQSTLSVKHLDASAVAAMLMLTQIAKAYFTTQKGKQDLYLKQDYQKGKPQLVLAKGEVMPAFSTSEVQDLLDIMPNRLSYLSVIELQVYIKGAKNIIPVDIRNGKIRPHMSKQLIKYVSEKGYSVDAKGNFCIDLEDWNYKDPVFSFTAKEENASEHAMQISKIIESKMEEITNREDPESPSLTLQELHRLVNSRLKVHLSCLEVIVYALMIPEPGDYGMARGAPNPVLGIGPKLIANRDLGALKAYQGHYATWLDVASYDKQAGRAENPMSVFLTPHEVVMAHHPEYAELFNE